MARAESYNLKKFQTDFPDCNVCLLEQNYRSTKRILDTANALIAPNSNRFPKVLWTENEDGVKAQLFSAYNEQDEAYFVCGQIKNLMSINPKYRFGDFAVLMRVNALSRSFEQQFKRERLPFKVFGGFQVLRAQRNKGRIVLYAHYTQ